ncbi:MAG: methyl-accepting chemotaxis protein [Candidatus Heimdallarchaeota archaeon]|nr:methyl-accepting chemotaxis protein [Candidatus Heimdallarchaeota archaeon]MDH5645776.1 methyl-accepting chemotaxis protein [Candidatus Heimdallarchaeota archaeon]
MTSILNPLKDMYKSIIIKKEVDESEFSYFWDYIPEEEIEKTNITDEINELLNLQLIKSVRYLSFASLVGLIITVFVGSILIQIIFSGLALSFSLIHTILVKNHIEEPMFHTYENIYQINKGNLSGTQDLHIEKLNTPILVEFDLMRSYFLNIYKSMKESNSEVERRANQIELQINNFEAEITRITNYVNHALTNELVYHNLSKQIEITSNEIDQLINSFDETLEEVDRILILTKSMSKQTSLLSLNAGIEAAKAGEAGVGFEVVATNLNRLSHHASDLSFDVSDITKEINKKVRQSILILTATLNELRSELNTTHKLITSVENDLTDSSRNLEAIFNLNKQISQILTDTEKYLIKIQ